MVKTDCCSFAAKQCCWLGYLNTSKVSVRLCLPHILSFQQVFDPRQAHESERMVSCIFDTAISYSRNVTNSAWHRQASQLSRESTLCVSRPPTGDDRKHLQKRYKRRFQDSSCGVCRKVTWTQLSRSTKGIFPRMTSCSSLCRLP